MKPKTNPMFDTPPKIVLWATVIVLLAGCARASSSTSTETVPLYLEESRPPCVFSQEEVDPCPLDVPPEVETLSVHSFYPAWPSGDNIRTFEQIFLRDYSIVSPHLVVRGIAKPNSSRCDLYPIQKANFLMEILERDYSGTYDYLNTHYHYHCFVDIEVSEYIVGKGPSVLTVSMLREVLTGIDPSTWDVEQAAQLQNPRRRTATAYEGREMILFLTTPSTIAVESWRAKGLFTVWFLQNTESGIRAVAQDIRYALTDGQRNKLNRPLGDIVKEIKEANEYRVEITNGRIGKDASLPLLVTDANHLRDYYIELGAVYNTGKDDTVLPPPVPGEGDPPAPTIPTNEGTTGTTVPAPGEEPTLPPPTDDAGLSVGQETTTTTGTTTTTTTAVDDTSTTTEVAPVVSTTTEATVTEPVTGTTTTTASTTTTTEPLGGESDTPTVNADPSEEEPTTTTDTPESGEVEIAEETTTTALPAGDGIPPPAEGNEPGGEPEPAGPVDETEN